MIETILTSAGTAVIAALATFALQERRLRAEMRTEFMAEQAARLLLETPGWKRRTFRAIKAHLSGFEDDELRKILVRCGAVRFPTKGGREWWGLIRRNRHKLRGPSAQAS